MTHGYKLRSSAKGRQGQYSQRTEETHKNVQGTSTPRAAAAAVHNCSATSTTTRYQANGSPELAPEITEDIRAARQREETRRAAEAIRIGREQIVRGYEGELRALRARIVALRCECEVKVERTRRKWEREWAIERGEVAMVVEDGGEEGSDWDWDLEDTDVAMVDDGEMAIDKNYPPANTSSLIITNNDDDQHQRQWGCAPRSSRSSSERNFKRPSPFKLSGSEMAAMAAVGRPLETMTEEDERKKGQQSSWEKIQCRGQGHHQSPQARRQPLRRQSAQLMVIP